MIWSLGTNKECMIAFIKYNSNQNYYDRNLAVEIKSLSAWAIKGAVSVRKSVFNNKNYKQQTY